MASRELQLLNDMIATELQQTKEEEKGLDLKCRFDDEQIRMSGIGKMPRIVLAVMDHILGLKEGANDDDYAIAMFAVLSLMDYKGTRNDFKNMMKRFFDLNVKVQMLYSWFERNGFDYSRWNQRTKVSFKRKSLACDFKELIDKVREYKSKKL